jgi:hypothetical protein
MKRIHFLALSLAVVTLLPSCSDDDSAPQIVNEEEVITTVTATFTPVGGGNTVTLMSRDLDGDGPDAPVVTVSGPFTTNKTYNGTVTFLNELQNPAGNITEEIEEEGVEHQLFFLQAGTLGTFAYADEDANGHPVGLGFTYNSAAAPATATLSIVLRHEPNKSASGVANGDITNAGGATDALVNFPVSVVAP